MASKEPVRSGHREFERFIRRVRRRFLMLRLLERTGLGILVACAAALPLLLIAIWRGLPAMPLASAMLVAGALAGLLWGILTRPGDLEAATEADRQLDWADLLASALSVAARGDDPWARAVGSMANSRCRQASPATIVLNRLGARAWGGIGLATALVVAVGVLPTSSTFAPAQNKTGLSAGDALLNPNTGEPVGRAFARPARTTLAQPEPEDVMKGRFGQDPTASADSDSPNRHASADNHSPGQNLADAKSQGAGAGRTDIKNSGELPAPRQGSDAASSDAKGTSSASGIGKSNPSAQGQGATSGVASDDATRNSVPPWRSSGWAQDVQRADDALNSGQIPDAYRDVVRGYFERQ
jgi:hypothetical protein